MFSPELALLLFETEKKIEDFSSSMLVFVCLMVFSTTFNISVISWWSVLFVEETGGAGKNQ